MMQQAYARALNNVGIIDYEQTIPKSAAGKRGYEVFERQIERTAADATDYLQHWLKERGFADGKISAILAAAVSSGSVGSLLAHLQREEAMSGSEA